MTEGKRYVPMTTHLVKHLVKLAQLGHFLHDLLLHEEGCVHGREAISMKQPHGVLDDGLFQKHRWTLKHVTHVTSAWDAPMSVCIGNLHDIVWCACDMHVMHKDVHIGDSMPNTREPV